MSATIEAAPPTARSPRRGFPAGPLLLGLMVGVLGTLFLGVVLILPLTIAHRNDLPLERLYGDFAVSMASRFGGGSQTNPVANNPRAVATGRDAYTGSCAECHGANGTGSGVFGTATYPNATDLTSHDAAEKSDAQTFWIIKNGLSFTGMPAFGDQYSDQDIWSMVSYLRALQNPASVPATNGGGQGGPGPGSGVAGGAAPRGGQGANPNGPAPAPAGGQNPGGNGAGAGGQAAGRFPGGGEGAGGGPFTLGPIAVPTPTTAQLDQANAASSDPAQRGAADYFALGCAACHGAAGDAPANLNIQRSRGNEITVAIRQGRPGMPVYPTSVLSNAQLADLQAYMNTFAASAPTRSFGGAGGGSGVGPNNDQSAQATPGPSR